nr:LPXTG cell wall anchor domain-containing protein [Staphylococcus chromogenes]
MTSTSLSTSDSTSGSMSSSESQAPFIGSTSMNQGDNTTTAQQAKVTEKAQLPDTGQATSNNGLVGAVAAMLAGLGLLRKSKKDKKKVTKSNK